MYLYFNVISTGDEFPSTNRNKKTCKLQVKNRLVLQCFSYLFIHFNSTTRNFLLLIICSNCTVLTTSNMLNYSSNLMNSSSLKREMAIKSGGFS